MSKNNQGYFLVETIIVLAIVATIITTLYVNSGQTYIKHKNELTKYNTVDGLYSANAVKKYLYTYEEDLKKAAKVANEKNVAMINVNDINKFTGYIRGGCSPIGMKKIYKTFVNESAIDLSTLIVSAGKIGYQVELAPTDLQELINCEFKDIVK